MGSNLPAEIEATILGGVAKVCGEGMGGGLGRGGCVGGGMN